MSWKSLLWRLVLDENHRDINWREKEINDLWVEGQFFPEEVTFELRPMIKNNHLCEDAPHV